MIIVSTITTPSVSLYYRQGSSDKEYHVRMEPQGLGFVVNFSYGRRGSTLTTGTKTPSPVDEQAAKKIFAKLVQEKKAKGYTEGPAGTPYQRSNNEQRVSGVLPQLLNPVDEDQLEALLNDTLHCCQEKFDGRRLLLLKKGETITGINRKGLAIGLPDSLIAVAKIFPIDILMDGEAVGEELHVFDLLECGGEDFRPAPYRQRYLTLLNLLASQMQRPIQIVQTAWTPQDKKILLRDLQAAKKEGIVFKRMDAPYAPGRPNSGGPQLKHKFYATLSAMVGRHNPQRSVELLLRKGVEWVSAGNVTIPPNHPVPECGQVVEVRYLHAFKESGVLYQPVYLGARSDVGLIECTVNQLKFKAADQEEP